MELTHLICLVLALRLADAYLVPPPGRAAPGAVFSCSEWLEAADELTCDSIEHLYGISGAQFEFWNPATTQLGPGCNLISGLYYCVQINYMSTPFLPRGSSTTWRTSTTPGLTARAIASPNQVQVCNPAPAPLPTQSGAACDCNDWHKVESYTTCDSIYDYYSISPTDFDKWNPQVGLDCASLLLGYYVCIGVDAIKTVKPTNTVVTLQPADTCNPAAPLLTQSDVTCGCSKWHEVASTTTCSNIYNYFHISPVNFAIWNPDVGFNCDSLLVGYYVCVGVSAEKCNPEAPSPIQSNAICGCADWHKITPTTTCSNIYNYYSISPANFDIWNPEVGLDCESLLVGYYVCVDVPAETCNPTAPSPTQPNVICDCTDWHKITSTTTCDNIYSYYRISPVNFDAWNPQVGTDCSGLEVGSYVCIGIPGMPGQVCNKNAPSPIQPNVICGCNKWHQIAPTTTCSNIYSYYSISPATFATWNPDVGSGCEDLLVGYYVCIDA